MVVGNPIGAKELTSASVVGPLCSPLNLLADLTELAKARPGNLLAVLEPGAYGASASPLGFLGHPGWVEVLV